MPTTKEKYLDSASVANRYGAGDSPPGEATAPPPGILDGVPDDIRRQLPDEVVDELLAGARTEEEIFGPGGVFGQLTKRLVERALEVELTDHLGYEPDQEPPGGTGNTRNGTSPKTLITEQGKVPIDAPRDRDGSFQRSSSASASGGSGGSTTRSSLSTRAASRPGTLRRTWSRSTGSRSAAI